MSDLFDFVAPRSQYAVMGNPVAHSKSPQIHAQFAEAAAVAMDYERIQVDAGGFKQAVSHFLAHGGAGLNITVPFKVEAWDLCQRAPNQLSARARLAEAVNTLKLTDRSTIVGDNTDGIGLVQDLTRNLDVAIKGSRILVVGAGGAVRGVLGPLLEQQPALLQVVNRTASKTSALVNHLIQAAPETLPTDALIAGGLDSATDGYDLIINGTAASLGGEIPALPTSCVGPDTAVYDMMYGARPTPFMDWARNHDVNRVHDGLGMLVEQAAESFHIWHGIHPNTAPVIAGLRAAMAEQD